jgi:hypothetical protein
MAVGSAEVLGLEVAPGSADGLQYCLEDLLCLGGLEGQDSVVVAVEDFGVVGGWQVIVADLADLRE